MARPWPANARDVGSIASVGFGLTGLCIAAERGWVPRAAAVERTRTTLRFFAERMEHQRGWFYHFVNLRTGAREWASELSSIDTALLLAGVLTVRQCFADDAEVPRLAEAIYRRVDFTWMLAGDPLLLSHGWKPETGFLTVALGSLLRADDPVSARPSDRRRIRIPAESWRAWRRPTDHLRELLVHRRPAAAVRAPVRARLGGFPRLARARAAADRLVRELGGRDPRAQRLLSEPGGGVSRLHATRVGHHGVGQPQGLRRLGRAAARTGRSTAASCRARRPAR